MFRLWTLAYLITLLCVLPANAYDLGPELCGGIYGGINVQFSEEIKSKKDIDIRLKKIQWSGLSYKPIVDSDTSFDLPGKTTLRKELWEAFDNSRRESDYLGVTDIFVPAGSEEQIAIALIKEKIIKKAGRAVGGCGATDLVALRLTRNQIDVEDVRLLSKYFENRLNSFVRGSNYSGFVESVKFTKSPFPPFFPHMEFSVISPSNLSRNTKNSHVWDRFNLIFQVVKFRDNGYDVLVYADVLQNAPMSILNKKPPSREYFKLKSGDRSMEELYAAGNIADYLSEGGGNCIVDAVVLDQVDRKMPNCSITREKLAN